MSKSSLDLQFQGAKHGVKVYADGQMVVHTTTTAGEATHLVISIRGGIHKLSTLAELKVTALLGPCTIAIAGGKKIVLKTNKKTTIAEGQTFSLEANGAVLQVVPQQGPGFGTGTGDRDLLP